MPDAPVQPPIARQSPRSRQVVLWIIAVLLGIIAVELGMRDDAPWNGSAAFAQSAAARVGARGIQAFTGQLDKSTYGLIMLDVDAGTIWCYEFTGTRPNERKMRLVAGRSWLHDRYLENFNQEEPTPDTVAAMIAQQRNLAPALPQSEVPPTPSEAPEQP